MRHRNTETTLLLQILEEAYRKKAWHGTNLKGSIRGLSVDQASWRPAAGRHNIWEIVVHTAYWKYAVCRRLLGAKRGSFPIKGSNWFVRPVEMTEASWMEDVGLLDNMHLLLRATIKEMTASSLRATPKGSKVPNITHVYGIALHDVYHAGQIQLLKRLNTQQAAR